MLVAPVFFLNIISFSAAVFLTVPPSATSILPNLVVPPSLAKSSLIQTVPGMLPEQYAEQRPLLLQRLQASLLPVGLQAPPDTQAVAQNAAFRSAPGAKMRSAMPAKAFSG